MRRRVPDVGRLLALWLLAFAAVVTWRSKVPGESGDAAANPGDSRWFDEWKRVANAAAAIGIAAWWFVSAAWAFAAGHVAPLGGFAWLLTPIVFGAGRMPFSRLLLWSFAALMASGAYVVARGSAPSGYRAATIAVLVVLGFSAIVHAESLLPAVRTTVLGVTVLTTAVAIGFFTLNDSPADAIRSGELVDPRGSRAHVRRP